ncbi:MAG: DUF4105 domain-containing protein [Bacteroidales bacterium]|jgi:hypothetical protein|nr:DUF4105 domain-containing protein [Bacteroidales bacterium]
MNKLLHIRRWLAVVFAASLCMIAGAQQLDPVNCEVSLLTADAGYELYATFGHSAIRVRDTLSGYDAVFNYGMFDFNAPNFYGNFAQGRMIYCLGVQKYERFIGAYAYEDREIREQLLLLNAEQKDFIIRFLLNNAKPENRNYHYHFFLDNCATRIRDLIDKTFGEVTWLPAVASPSYRELVYDCTLNQPWGRFGIDIALGLPTDKKTDAWEQMFLPDYLSDAVATATCHGKPIAGEIHAAFKPENPLVVQPSRIIPMMVCCAVLALALLFCFVQRGARVFDFFFFLVIGLIGVLVVFLWFFTDHTNTHGNLNIIWALPTHLVMAFYLLIRRKTAFFRWYFLVTAVIASLLLVSWAFLPQHLNQALMPVVVAIVLRACYNSRIFQRRSQP